MKRVFMNGILFTLVSIVWFSFGSVTVHAADDILGGVPAEYDQRLQFHIDWTDSSYAEGNVYHSSYADFVLGFKSSEDIVAWVDNTEKGPLRFAPFSQLEKDSVNTIYYASAYVVSAAQDDGYSSWPKDKNVGSLWNSPLLLYPAISSNTIDCNCTYTADFPIFDSFESARRYYLSNKEDTSGLLQSPQNELYDENLPGVKNLSLEPLSMNDCHGKIDNFNMCFNLSWDLPEGFLEGDFYTVKMVFKYNYATSWSTKRLYGSSFEDLSSFFEEPIYIDSCSFDVCSHDLVDNMDLALKNDFDHVSAFTIQNVQKIYIRSGRVINGNTYYGDWYIYNVNKDNSLSLDYNNPELGEGVIIPGNTEIDINGNIPGNVVEKDKIPAVSTGNENIFAGIDFSDVSGVLGSFYSILKNLIGALGSFPALFSSVFSFLPYEIRTSILLIFYIAIIVGLLKIFT